MRFASLIERIGGESADCWAVHYEAVERLKAGADIIILSVGQETHEFTPEPIQQAAIDSILSGRHHYTPTAGEMRLRQAIAERHSMRTKQMVSANNVTVFAGAQNALFASSLCLLETGAEVIVLEPYYATYPATFTVGGARLVSLPTRLAENFQPDIDAIAAAMTPATRVLVLNSPNNPTGAVYTRERLQALLDLCKARDIWIISDEVYAEFAPADDYTSICSLAGADAITITVSSVSKSHRMTGWRCGWTVAPAVLAAHFAKLCLCMSYGLPPFIQDAALYALETHMNCATEIRQALIRRRDVLIRGLNGLSRTTLYSNPGAMFATLDIRALNISGPRFAWDLLDRYNVSVLPCDGFGDSGRGLLRISLCENEQRLATACERIRELIPPA